MMWRSRVGVQQVESWKGPRAVKRSEGVAGDHRALYRRAATVSVRIGAEGGTRTPTSCLTRPSNVRVYQFRHFGSSILLAPQPSHRLRRL